MEIQLNKPAYHGCAHQWQTGRQQKVMAEIMASEWGGRSWLQALLGFVCH